MCEKALPISSIAQRGAGRQRAGLETGVDANAQFGQPFAGERACHEPPDRRDSE